MHIAPFDNKNSPIVDVEDQTVPLNYFNIVKLTKGQAFDYQVPGYETCIVPATGTIDVDVEGFKTAGLGGRVEDVWGGEPEGVYVPSGAKVEMVCQSEAAEVFIAGAKYDWCNMARMTPKHIAKSNIYSAKSSMEKLVACW